jgi:hypothetical protein
VALLAAFTVVLVSTVTLGVIMPRLGTTSRLPSASPIQASAPAVRRVAAVPVDSAPGPEAGSTPAVPATDSAVRLASQPRDSQPRDTTPDQPAASRAPVTPPAGGAAQVAAAPVADAPIPAPQDTAARDSAPRVVGQPDPIPPPSAPPRTPLTRWVGRQWVNVREGPADNTPIAGVLRPGQRVEAGAPTRDGWQMVYVDGRRMGYVARSLLTSEPPR